MGDTSFAVVDAAGRRSEGPELPVNAVSLGRGVFETVLVLSGRAVFAREHAERLAASCEALEIATPEDARDLFEHGLAFAGERPMPRGRLRVAVFGRTGQEQSAALLALADAGEPKPQVALSIADGRASISR